MRRLLPLLVLIIAVGALAGAGAWAHAADRGDAATNASRVASRELAPFAQVPTSLPARQAPHSSYVYSFSTAQRLGDEVRAASTPRARRVHAPVGGATITVTATVLPSVVVSLDHAGNVSTLTANTDARAADHIMFVLPRALDARTWAQVRSALAHAHAGTGVIWAA